MPRCGASPKSRTPLKLSILGLGLEAGQQLREDALAEYGAKTGIDFDLVPTPGSSAEQLPLVLDLFRTKSTSPDVFVIDGSWPGSIHEHLVDLTPYLNDESRRHAKPLLKKQHDTKSPRRLTAVHEWRNAVLPQRPA